MFRILTILVLATSVGSGVAMAQGTVSGIVLDPNGVPLPNSLVEGFPVESDGFVGNVTWTKSDDHGNFRLTLRDGHYEIRAKNEPEGYPDPNALLSVDPRAMFPQINVAKQNIGGVEVRLGPKGAILEGVTCSPVSAQS